MRANGEREETRKTERAKRERGSDRDSDRDRGSDNNGEREREGGAVDGSGFGVLAFGFELQTRNLISGTEHRNSFNWS